MKPTVAEISADPANLTFHAVRARPGLSRSSATRRSSTAPRRYPSSRRCSGWAMVLHNQYPWDRAAARLEEVGRIGDDDFVVAFTRATGRSCEFIHRVRAGRPARPRPVPPAEAGPPVRPYPPVDVREQFSVMPRLEALAVVKGEVVCTNEDLIRNAAYNWSPMTRGRDPGRRPGSRSGATRLAASSTSPCRPPGRRSTHAGRRPRRSARSSSAPARARG